MPIETTGDQEVNAHSRVQMMLFKARQKAQKEFEQALVRAGPDRGQLQARAWRRKRRFKSPFWRPAHKAAGIAANLVYAV